MTKAMSGWRMSPQAERVRAELARRFLENPADAAIWRPAGRQAIPAVVCIIAVILSLLPCVNARAGPVTWVVMIACVVVFIAMQILGDQEVMLWLAWPFDPTLKFSSGVTSPTR